MSAPVLRRYTIPASTFAAVDTLYTVVSAVPANRALVIGKVLVVSAVNKGATTIQTFSLYVGNSLIAWNMPLGPGEVYTETGLVLLAGETLTARTDLINGISVSVFGEEVAN